MACQILNNVAFFMGSMHVDTATAWKDIEFLSYNHIWMNNNIGARALTKFSLRNL